MYKKFLTLLVIGLSFAKALSAQTADDIINKHIEARGGLAKLKALESIVMTGSLNQNGTDVTMKFVVAQNKGARVEYSVMGQTGYSIVTPAAGWNMNPFMGATEPTALTPDQLKESQTQLDIQGPFVDYKTKGNKIEYLGKETVDGKECFKIKLTRASGKTSTYYFDNSYNNVRNIITVTGQDGNDQELTTDYSDFRKTPEGYTFAFKRSVPQGEINFDKIEVNTKIDDAQFKPGN